jgi:hypothetical protein
MTLGSASHQKSGQPERVVTIMGEALDDATRDEARPAWQQQEGLPTVLDRLIQQALLQVQQPGFPGGAAGGVP